MWRGQHKETWVMPTARRYPPSPFMPYYPINSGPKTADEDMSITFIPGSPPLAIPTEKITHEPLSNSLTLMFTGDCSVSALISVPARTVVCPGTFNVLPLRLRTIGGAAAPLPPAPPPLGAAAPR